jgi:single-strand DNA-binding protein
VVLQGFNSNLTMLDGRAGAGGGGGMHEETTPYDRGNERASTGGKSRSEPAKSGGGSFDKDLDDEIPF